MAEAIIGLIASVATLSKVATSSIRVVRKVKNVSADIEKIREELIHLRSQSHLISEIYNDHSMADLKTDQSITYACTVSVQQARKKIDSLNDRLSELASKASGARGLVRWIIIGQSEASALLKSVQSTRESLTFTLELASFIAVTSPQSWPVMITPQPEYSKQADSGPSSQQLTSCSAQQGRRYGTSPILSSTQMQDGQECLGCSSVVTYNCWTGTFALPLLGHYCSLFVTKQTHQRYCTFSMSFLLELPFTHILVGNIFIRVFAQNYLNFRILRGTSLGMANLVNSGSEFLKACENGDLMTMRYMLANRLASPNDTTLQGLTPMCYAIEGGHLDAVKILIDEGADVDGLFGTLQTSPLSWAIRNRQYDIIRLLLSYDASCQHVSGIGWTPLFYLWPGPVPSERAADGILDMLSCRQDFALSHVAVSDKAGFGLIHQAVIFGTSTEIAKLISLGVDTSMQQGAFKWNAIQIAVSYGQFGILQVLLSHERNFDVDMRDERGWTLLHISAAEGHDDITRLLLKLGADWKAVTYPNNVNTESSLRGQRSTPLQVAAAYGIQYPTLFLKAVRDIRGPAGMSEEELEELKEEVWVDAEQELLDYCKQ